MTCSCPAPTWSVPPEALRNLIAKQFPAAGKITTHVTSGNAWYEICLYAERDNIDMIVMATHGLTGAKRLFLGSTAEARRATRILPGADRQELCRGVCPRRRAGTIQKIDWPSCDRGGTIAVAATPPCPSLSTALRIDGTDLENDGTGNNAAIVSTQSTAPSGGLAEMQSAYAVPTWTERILQSLSLDLVRLLTPNREANIAVGLQHLRCKDSTRTQLNCRRWKSALKICASRSAAGRCSTDSTFKSVPGSWSQSSVAREAASQPCCDISPGISAPTAEECFLRTTKRRGAIG